ncbi:MAG: hypothetical protein ACRDKY_01805 [Solirubrobacteraceae bacterium]
MFDSPRTGTVTKDGRERIGTEFGAVWAASENYRLTVTGSDRKDDVTIVTGRFSQEVPLTKERPAGPVSFEVVAADGRALIRKIHSRVEF